MTLAPDERYFIEFGKKCHKCKKATRVYESKRGFWLCAKHLDDTYDGLRDLFE